MNQRVIVFKAVFAYSCKAGLQKCLYFTWMRYSERSFFLNSAMNNDVQIMSAHVLYALTYLAVSAHSFNYCRDHI